MTARYEEALRHHEAGRLATAGALYHQVLRDDPDHAGSLHLTGLIAAQTGDPEAGAAAIARAIRLNPGQAPFHNSLALTLRLRGRLTEAEHEYRTAAELRPGSAEILNNLATVLRDLGRAGDAAVAYREALAAAPGIAEIWYNLASTLTGPEAERCFRQALALKPDYPDAWHNFGRYLAARCRWREAEGALAKVTALRPDDAAAWCDRGAAHQALDHMADAADCYERSILLRPGHAAAHYNLGCLRSLEGDAGGATVCHARALAADPDFAPARIGFCMAQLPIVYRSAAEVASRRRQYIEALNTLISGDTAGEAGLAAAVGTSQPFFLAYQGEDDAALQDQYGRFACRLLADQTPIAPRPRPGERIRLGIVSGFFQDHTIWTLFLEGWLTQLDRAKFEILGFHTGGGQDDRTALAARLCDRFHHALGSGDAWRAAIVAEAPHVLLYPEIGMDPLAARLAAQRLARVQCVTWGHPVTTGYPTLDYFLSSDLMEPPVADAHYTERLVRLPNLGLYAEPDSRPPCSGGGPLSDVPVFWSGQALYKYLPADDFVFPRIASRVGDCRFIFIEFAKSRAVTTIFRDRLAGAFADQGLDAAKYCVFLPPMTQNDYLTALRRADVVLDTIGWSGGKSTLDALATGPVIVTTPGRFMRGRHTAAILRRIGLADCVAETVEDYVALAVALALDPVRRAAVRERVARGRHLAFRDTAYIRALETFLIGAAEAS